MTSADTKSAPDATPAGESPVSDVPTGIVHVEPGQNGIRILRLGAPTERMVTLTEARMDSLEATIAELEKDTALRGLVVTGPDFGPDHGDGPGMFAAGADINLIADVTDPEVGAAAARRGASMFGRLGALPVPVVAAIDGPCLGGALELALALDRRVASDHPSTSIGLPEVKLGIIPGFGGTQRLTRLIGLPKALDMILQGKLLRPAQAGRYGVADKVVPRAKLLATAIAFASTNKKKVRRKLRGADRWFTKLPPLRALVRRKVEKQLSTGQARFFDAPKQALRLCLDAVRLRKSEGFENEARVLGELIVSPTSKGLTHLYFLTERAKKLGKSDAARDVQSVLVLGGGVMGAGIAGALANKGARVRLADLEPQNLLNAKRRLQKALDKKLERRHIKKHEATAVQDRLTVSSEWGMLGATDLLLEAVPESLDLKRKIFADAVERGLRDDAIVATNTSSLSIDAMAESLPNPERVVGIHFFNPPEKMPLVEVIRGPRTSPEAVATACRLAVRLGKFPVVVGDAPGFLVNRCLAPYINEAARLLIEGNSPEFIDQVMLDFGLPMGPARLLDEVGFDVAAKVSEVLTAAFPDRMEPSPLFEAMVEAGHLGQKTGGGLYDAEGKTAGPGLAVVQRLRRENGGGGRLATRTEVHHRLVYPLVAEAYRVLEDGLVESEADLDLGLVFGMGFPPFTGGVTKYARAEGCDKISAVLWELRETHGERFAPPGSLRDTATF